MFWAWPYIWWMRVQWLGCQWCPSQTPKCEQKICPKSAHKCDAICMKLHQYTNHCSCVVNTNWFEGIWISILSSSALANLWYGGIWKIFDDEFGFSIERIFVDCSCSETRLCGVFYKLMRLKVIRQFISFVSAKNCQFCAKLVVGFSFGKQKEV